MRQAVAYLAFNRGLVSKLALARQDIKRIGMSAEIMVNWRPRVLGAMTLRPGLAYLGNTYQNTRARYLPFVFATDDVALVEMTPAIMRIWIQDALLSRVSVGSAVTNGTFNGNIAQLDRRLGRWRRDRLGGREPAHADRQRHRTRDRLPADHCGGRGPGERARAADRGRARAAHPEGRQHARE
jgi:hypothetical protein